MKATAECFRKEANYYKVTNEKKWGNAKGKIENLWNLYISLDQHEREWNIKVEALWQEDGSKIIRRKVLYGRPPYMLRVKHLLDARKSYQMGASSVENILPNDVIKVIISMQSHTRFLNVILQFMNKNGMSESLHLLRKESGVAMINLQAFGDKKDELHEFFGFYLRNERYVEPLFKEE